MRAILFVIALAAALLFAGCAQTQPAPPGSDRDSHGCIPSAGYQWCDAQSKCIRPWETNCTAAPMPGSDRDAHGCIPSAGYSWCNITQSCIRPWETNCTANAEVRILAEEFPPFSYKDSGAVVGRSTAVVNSILAKLGQSANIEIMNFPDAYKLALEKPNVAFYSAARNAERETLFKWVGPIGTYDKTLFMKNGSALKVNSLDDAKKAASICVVQYDDRQQTLSAKGFTNLVMKQNDSECLLALSQGKVTLWFGSSDTLPYVEKQTAVAAGTAVPALHVESTDIYVAFSKGTPDSVIQKWQAVLDEIKSSQQLVGGDRDEHGCIGSAGYQWCPELSKCVRSWEENCPSLKAKALDDQAKSYCANDTKVYLCGEYIKVVSGMPGAGSKFYTLGNYDPVATCPVIAPDYMTPACRQLLLGNNCVETEVC